MKVTIPIFWITEHDAFLNDLGVKTPIESNEVRYITFYNINYVATYVEDGKEYGMIGCNNEDLISPLSKEQILKLIERND